MICSLIRCIAFMHLLAFCSAQCDAAIIHTYSLTNLGPSGTAGFLGSSFSINATGLSDGGVSFTATLTVTGSGNIGYNSDPNGGIGIAGNTLDGSAGGESLRFAIQILNPVGGSVAFNGFTIIGFSNFTNEDLAVLSNDNNFSTAADNTPVGTSSGTLGTAAVPGSPSSFSIFSNSSNHFSVASVRGSFTGTAAAVPEPSTLMAIAMVASFVTVSRGFRRRRNSVDSGSLVA